MPGNYYCRTIITAKTLKNCPTSQAFIMKVEFAAGSDESYPSQIIRELNTGKMYYRVWIAELNQWLDDASYVMDSELYKYLSTSIIEEAEQAKVGLHFYYLAGDEYAGNDLPSVDYAFGSALILKRGTNSITIVLFGSTNATSLAIKQYRSNFNWLNWQIYNFTEKKLNTLSN